MTLQRSIIAGTLALLLAPASVSSIAAQSAQPAAEESVQPRWTENYGEQTRHLLTSGDPERMDNAMMLILHYEQRRDLEIDFRPAVPALFQIYESDTAEGRRLLALAALEAIGGESMLQRLARRVRNREEPSDRVKQQTLRVLTAHRQGRNHSNR